MKVEIIKPVFDRNDGIEPDEEIPTEEGEIVPWLKRRSADELEALGLRRWDGDLWLLPFEWYDSIPEGTELVTISGEEINFDPEEQMKEKRFGVLPYGIEV